VDFHLATRADRDFTHARRPAAVTVDAGDAAVHEVRGVPGGQSETAGVRTVPGAVQSVIDITYPVDLLPATKDALAASVLNNILGGSGFQTRLMQNLREDKAYTYGAYSEISPDDYIGYFSAGASVRNEVTDSSITQLMYEISRLTTELVDDKTLQIVKNIMTGQFARSLERPQTVARFAQNIERYHLPKDFYETYLERLNAITAEDVKNIASRILLPNNAYITVVGNKEIERTILPFDKDGKIMKFNPDGTVYVEMKAVPAGVTAETVINNYFNAIGGADKIEKIKSVEYKGLLDVGMAKLDMNTKIIPHEALKVTMSMNGNPMMIQTWDGTQLNQTSNVANGTVANSILRWNGSNWVQDSTTLVSSSFLNHLHFLIICIWITST
jgi:hypothetical protein